ncbi:MAG: M14 family metallopeptidase [Flavobacteriaceae bacterium]|nr:M14 family metallopeptidase [Flavobacteriaceae bacterium]
MYRFLISFTTTVFFAFILNSQVTLDYYLDKDHPYDSLIPTPQQILGFQIGQWHVSHDQVIQYMSALAESSDRIKIETIGKSYEHRPLILLTITSEDNHQNLDAIQQKHYNLTTKEGKNIDTNDMPVVVYQGFTIHGNEPSGVNASLLTAYHLVASQSPKVKELLNQSIILIDPCMNPDGMQRFSNWVNSHRSIYLNPDANDREFHEIWPSGRTNHYWFDLNRDWLLLQHPESRARVQTLTKWYPNIIADFHEMGTNSTYFFQPGVKSRVHPMTPKMNQTLTAKIADFHVEALDSIGSLYYSKETFDDFYYGKGSTYPDVNGGIGILYEQGSSRGHAQNSQHGVLTFPYTIRNQLTTTLSTLEAAQSLRLELLNYLQDFYSDSFQMGRSHKSKGILFGNEKDPVLSYHLAKLLKQHEIELYSINKSVEKGPKRFDKSSSYFIPIEQKKHRLIRSIFDYQTEFEDSIFYDVSAWNFPLSFNVDFSFEDNSAIAENLIQDLTPPIGTVTSKSKYAYLVSSSGYYLPKLMRLLHDSKIHFKVGRKEFEIQGKEYSYGSLLIPVQTQTFDSEELYKTLKVLANETKLIIDGVNTGYGSKIDLGSNSFITIDQPKIALLVGQGVRSYDAGEIWHLFDYRFETPITKIDTRYIHQIDLKQYTHLIIPSTSSRVLNNSKEKIESFVNSGGVLIAYRDSINWLKQKEWIDIEWLESETTAENISFEDRQNFWGAQQIGGAIFKTNIDRSHPINYGYTHDQLPIFRNTTLFVKADKNSYHNPIQYTSNPLISGYISDQNLEHIKGSVPFKVQQKSNGKIIIFTDNTNFRAFWFGTNRLLTNAIYFSDFM